MRIAIVITELDPGGAEKCASQLAEFLAAGGHAVRLFAIGPPPIASQCGFVDALKAAGVQVVFYLPTGKRRTPLNFLGAVRWLRRCLLEFQPDIVQSMLFHANLLAALATDRNRTKLFGGVRVRQPERTRGFLQRWASRRMQLIVCVSQDVARHCIENEGIEARKVVTIPNGIDTQAIDCKYIRSGQSSDSTAVAERPTPKGFEAQWSSLGVPDNARVLLFVGRLHAQKGVDRLVAQADAILSQLPEHHLVIMGGGPLETQLRDQQLQLAHRDRLHLVGWQPATLDWMRQSELLLLPASYEGMPNVVLEAMAVGLPCVAFAVEGVRELLGESRLASEQAVTPENWTAFVEQVVKLASDPQLRSECAKQNRLRVEQNFELVQQFEKYLRLYEGNT